MLNTRVKYYDSSTLTLQCSLQCSKMQLQVNPLKDKEKGKNSSRNHSSQYKSGGVPLALVRSTRFPKEKPRNAQLLNIDSVAIANMDEHLICKEKNGSNFSIESHGAKGDLKVCECLSFPQSSEIICSKVDKTETNNIKSSSEGTIMETKSEEKPLRYFNNVNMENSDKNSIGKEENYPKTSVENCDAKSSSGEYQSISKSSPLIQSNIDNYEISNLKSSILGSIGAVELEERSQSENKNNSIQCDYTYPVPPPFDLKHGTTRKGAMFKNISYSQSKKKKKQLMKIKPPSPGFLYPIYLYKEKNKEKFFTDEVPSNEEVVTSKKQKKTGNGKNIKKRKHKSRNRKGSTEMYKLTNFTKPSGDSLDGLTLQSMKREVREKRIADAMQLNEGEASTDESDLKLAKSNHRIWAVSNKVIEGIEAVKIENVPSEKKKKKRKCRIVRGPPRVAKVFGNQEKVAHEQARVAVEELCRQAKLVMNNITPPDSRSDSPPTQTQEELLNDFRTKVGKGKGRKKIDHSPIAVVNYASINSSDTKNMTTMPRTYQQLGLQPLQRSPSSQNYFPKMAAFLRGEVGNVPAVRSPPNIRRENRCYDFTCRSEDPVTTKKITNQVMARESTNRAVVKGGGAKQCITGPHSKKMAFCKKLLSRVTEKM